MSSMGQDMNNVILENDNFERNLQDMLEDNPSDGDVGSTLSDPSNTGTPQHVPFSQPPNSLPLSQNNVMPPANTNVPLTTPSPSQNGEDYNRNPCGVNRVPPSKIDTIKQWSISTYKCTRQILSEKLGKVTRTVDTEMETQIEMLRDTQRKYTNILRLARALTSHFYHMVQTQTALAESFSELAQKSPQLQDEFLYNAETQRNISKNGETLLGALNFFVSTVNTLCNKTMDDTLQTVKQYEIARIEYDAYRSDLEVIKEGQRADLTKMEEAQRSFNAHKEKFERLRADVNVKLKFLEENKVKVMHKQLLLFHNAISAYFSGNQAALEATLKQFSIKMKNPNSSSPSWLEQPSTFVIYSIANPEVLQACKIHQLLSVNCRSNHVFESHEVASYST